MVAFTTLQDVVVTRLDKLLSKRIISRLNLTQNMTSRNTVSYHSRPSRIQEGFVRPFIELDASATYDSIQSIKDVYVFFMEKSDKEVIEELQRLKLVKYKGTCCNPKKRCPVTLTLAANKCMKGHYCFFCKMCKKMVSLTKKSFFENTHLSFEQIFVLIWNWINMIPASRASTLNNLALKSLTLYYKMFRDVVSWKLMGLHKSPIGGPDHIVQIDETLITKKTFKENGETLSREHIILGMVDITAKESRLVYIIKEKGDSLVPVIESYVAKGTEIWSDNVTAFRGLHKTKNYQYKTMDRSKCLSTDGVNINNVLNEWSRLKRFCRKADIYESRLLPEHLDEYIWRESKQHDPQALYTEFLQNLVEKYPF